MTAEIKGGNLIITLPAHTDSIPPSKSGKTLLVATTNGNQPSGAMVKGQPLIVSVNAYIKR